ncbi:MFS transporter, SP family, sugar porter [Prevotella communis]|uniref:MFS transporter, SP family, sugar porter n=1 Tax=Prevotella communis TaxID=2913614 RepID=A0A1G7TI72_9BACT|nr:sugar porter family MFS transporter [Prevotella communis]UKK60145.1 sugar porter family MFS transporter [Prevotella communis]UKK68123.1 sugar porter family MFS transporter [Prevotella communis]UKK69740.1 sugar porter family MFS transporter [Prevotella communis]SDG34901.1 MFS transporter, SP family, sugar porter [Prevotella communis]
MLNNNKAFVYFICSVSAMGGLLFGYDWVVIGGAKPFYESFFGIAGNTWLQGVAMSTALVGCLIGAMVAGALADRYGRKPLLTTAAVLFTVSAIGTGLFDDFTLFNIARFIGGVGIGVASALSPMYIAEVSPAHIRGRMVSLNQMTIVLGILGAQIVNMLLARDTSIVENAAWNLEWGWRWMFWAETVPAGLFLVMSFFIPESPVYQQMKAATMSQHTGQKAGLKELMESKYSKVLLLGLVIAVFQQWCGTNVIFNYAQEIFVGAGYDVDGMFIDIVITGIANVVFTFVALYTIEKWGRRTLMLIGAGGLGLIYLTLGTCYFLEVKGVMMVVLVVTAISVYAMTLGPVTWTLLAEIFPNQIRGVAMAVCTFALWVGCCTLTFSFPSMNAALGSSGTFWIYSAICVCAFIFLWRRCPETKGKTLEQLEKELV